MIGIYKITNKLNNKSYIGQSIHCVKRLEEHFKGEKQFIVDSEEVQNYLKEIEKIKISKS